MKKYYPLIVAFGLALIIGFYFPNANYKPSQLAASAKIENTLVNQEITEYLEKPIKVIKLYDSGQLIGVVQDYSKITDLVQKIYQRDYVDKFPDNKIDLGVDIYPVEEMSYYITEDKDIEICNYLETNNLFSIETNIIEFSDSNGVYATMYIKNLDDFYDARNDFLLNFVSQDDLDTFAANKEVAELTAYGSRTLNVVIKETINVETALAKPADIMTTYEEVLNYFCYGDNTKLEYYTVNKGETLLAIGTLTNGLTPQQLITINPGVLTEENQVLEEGMQVNVTYFTSPITVEVKKEKVAQEIVYPDKAIYLADSDIREGMSYVYQEDETGLKNVKYEEEWVNGVLIGGEEVSSVVTTQPIQRIEYYGTKVIPGIGTGNLRYPVNNVRITCGWYCYSGHTAIDCQDRYNKWSYIYAADRGTIYRTGYTSLGGYYVRINHNNGMITYYGHMRELSSMTPGVNVDKGEIIGRIGMTGRTTGPHTHFMVSVNGRYVNPCNYLGC
jgi:murein DD-endopeptidase MepM/ murein hydrolase activator NlpD